VALLRVPIGRGDRRWLMRKLSRPASRCLLTTPKHSGALGTKIGLTQSGFRPSRTTAVRPERRRRPCPPGGAWTSLSTNGSVRSEIALAAGPIGIDRRTWFSGSSGHSGTSRHAVQRVGGWLCSACRRIGLSALSQQRLGIRVCAIRPAKENFAARSGEKIASDRGPPPHRLPPQVVSIAYDGLRNVGGGRSE